MPGTTKNPVILDHFQNIIEVGWSGEDLGIVEFEHIATRSGPVGAGLQGGAFWLYTQPSYIGRIRNLNGFRDARLGVGEFVTAFNEQFPQFDDQARPPQAIKDKNYTDVIGNDEETTCVFGSSFGSTWSDSKNLSLRSDPPFAAHGPFSAQCPDGGTEVPGGFPGSQNPGISDMLMPGGPTLDDPTADFSAATKFFFDNYYMWYCGCPRTSSGRTWCNYLINLKKLKKDYDAGFGLDIGDHDGPQFSFGKNEAGILGRLPIPQGGPSQPLLDVDLVWWMTDDWSIPFRGGDRSVLGQWTITFRTYRGVNGVFSQSSQGFVDYVSGGKEGQEVSLVQEEPAREGPSSFSDFRSACNLKIRFPEKGSEGIDHDLFGRHPFTS